MASGNEVYTLKPTIVTVTPSVGVFGGGYNYRPLPLDSTARILRGSYETRSLPALSTKFYRAGIIPYSGEGDSRIYYFTVYSGLDTYTRQSVVELSDFGGVVVQRQEDYIEAACRECDEESLGLFKFDPNFVYSTGSALWSEDQSMIVLLVPIERQLDPEQVKEIWKSRQFALRQYNRHGITMASSVFSERTFYSLLDQPNRSQSNTKYSSREVYDLQYLSHQELLTRLTDSSIQPPLYAEVKRHLVAW